MSAPRIALTGIMLESNAFSPPATEVDFRGLYYLEGDDILEHARSTADPMFFEHLGLDVGRARTMCVKSRGHFRAGFEPWFPPAQVLEVDAAGLTSPVLDRLEWRRLPRPLYPLDAHAAWWPSQW